MLISISTIVVGLFLYLRAIHKGQYDDVESPAIRMLFEDELVESSPKENTLEKTHTSYHKKDTEKQTTT